MNFIDREVENELFETLVALKMLPYSWLIANLYFANGRRLIEKVGCDEEALRREFTPLP